MRLYCGNDLIPSVQYVFDRLGKVLEEGQGIVVLGESEELGAD
jgi:hypothetical protein